LRALARWQASREAVYRRFWVPSALNANLKQDEGVAQNKCQQDARIHFVEHPRALLGDLNAVACEGRVNQVIDDDHARIGGDGGDVRSLDSL
jgi:hypothetical protein